MAVAESVEPFSFSTYRELSKSGIVSLVLISVLGGYLIGYPLERPFYPGHLLFTLLGVLLLASGSSALNQIQESKIDAEMPRTSKRPLPSGRISSLHAAAFTAVTMLSGLLILSRVSFLVFCLGLLAVASYNGFYTLWWKKNWSYAAVPGAIPGALPILMGFVASYQGFNPAGFYLFFILFFWQMPHFWVLALRYSKDYEKGGIPTLPVTHGSGVTVFQIALWCLAYVGLALIAPLFLRVRTLYLITALLMSGKILLELRHFMKAPESKSWLRFFLWVNFSLIIYIAAMAADLWSVYVLIPLKTR